MFSNSKILKSFDTNGLSARGIEDEYVLRREALMLEAADFDASGETATLSLFVNSRSTFAAVPGISIVAKVGGYKVQTGLEMK